MAGNVNQATTKDVAEVAMPSKIIEAKEVLSTLNIEDEHNNMGKEKDEQYKNPTKPKFMDRQAKLRAHSNTQAKDEYSNNEV